MTKTRWLTGINQQMHLFSAEPWRLLSDGFSLQPNLKCVDIRKSSGVRIQFETCAYDRVYGCVCVQEDSTPSQDKVKNFFKKHY